MLMSVLATAQMQTGYVKTKGRMVGGQLVHGKGLQGAIVTIQGRTSVGVQNADGSFSFPVVGNGFTIQSVTKKGYRLVDADVVAKPCQYSQNPVYLVMEAPEQQLEDLLEAEEKISRGLKLRYQRSLAENKHLMEENRITQEEYQRRLQRLASEQQGSSKLVSEMSRRYASIDYDQLDEFGRQVSELILNGELSKADSLLNTKGDMMTRAETIKKEWQALNSEKADLQQRTDNVTKVREHLQKRLNELAADCYGKYELFKMQFMVDSAMHYLRQRTELDTMNTCWMYDYARYCYDNNYTTEAIEICKRILIVSGDSEDLDAKNLLGILLNITGHYKESAEYFEEVLAQRRQRFAGGTGTAEQLASSLMNLGNTYKELGEFDKAKKAILESIDIKRQQAKDVDGEYEVAVSLHNLGTLYAHYSCFSDAEPCLKEAMEIYRRCMVTKPQELEYQLNLARLLNYYGAIKHETGRREEGEQMVKESVDILSRLSEKSARKYEFTLCTSLTTLSVFYKESSRLDDYEKIYLKILDIRRHYVREDSLLYGHGLVNALDTLANFYGNTGRRAPHMETLREKVQLCRYLTASNPQKYKPTMAWDLYVLAMGEWDESPQQGMAHCRESLALYEELVKESPQYYELVLANVLGTWADYCSEGGTEVEAEEAYLRTISIFRRREGELTPSGTGAMAVTLYNLALLYYHTSQWAKSKDIFLQARDVYGSLAAQNAERYATSHMGTINMLATICSKENDYKQAVAFCQEGLTAAKVTGKPANQVTFYNNLSFFSIFCRDYDGAEAYARKGIEIDGTQGRLHTNLALALLLQGKTDAALDLYRQYTSEYGGEMRDDLKKAEDEGLLAHVPAEVIATVRNILK